MDGGSSAIIKEFVMDANSRVIMGGNSIIKVTEKTVMNNTAQSFEDAGIIGPQSGDLYAVLQSPVMKRVLITTPSMYVIMVMFTLLLILILHRRMRRRTILCIELRVMQV